MECYITYCVKGFFAFNSENELICEKLFPKDEIINRLAEINDKQIVSEEMEIIEDIRNAGVMNKEINLILQEINL